MGKAFDAISAFLLSALMVCMGSLTVGLFGLVVLFCLSLAFHFSMLPFVNPLQWPIWLRWIAGFYWLLGALALFAEFRGSSRHDLNVYFDHNQISPVPGYQGPTALPLDALIVHA